MPQFMIRINVALNAAVGFEDRWHPTDKPQNPYDVESSTGRVNRTLLSLYRYDNMVLQFCYLVGNIRSHKFSAKHVS